MRVICPRVVSIGNLVLKSKAGGLARTKMDVRYRAATSLDASVLAPMNAQLIRDEGHRTSMTMPQLTERMSEWLKSEYQAFLFELEGKTIGYALYSVVPES